MSEIETTQLTIRVNLDHAAFIEGGVDSVIDLIIRSLRRFDDPVRYADGGGDYAPDTDILIDDWGSRCGVAEICSTTDFDDREAGSCRMGLHHRWFDIPAAGVQFCENCHRTRTALLD